MRHCIHPRVKISGAPNFAYPKYLSCEAFKMELNDTLSDSQDRIFTELGAILSEDGFECIEVDDEETSRLARSNAYIKQLVDATGLRIIQADKVAHAYRDNGFLGLFHLFLTKSWFEAVRVWTKKKMVEDNKRDADVTKIKFQAYLGLELAMSITQFNAIEEYWQQGMFCGSSDFKNVMSRDDFMAICGSVNLRDPDSYNHDEASADPLCHTRKMMEHLEKNIATIAVPVGTSALDENTARTKARTRARSYMPNKPDPYGIRFYAVVGSEHMYLHSLFNNNSGLLFNM